MKKIKIGGLAALLALAVGLSGACARYNSKKIAQNYTKVDTVMVEEHQTWWDIVKKARDTYFRPQKLHMDDVGEEMKKLNQIKDINWIYPGQKIAVPNYSTSK